MFGAALMVQVGVLTTQQANASIHVTTIFLLMGLMLILAMLEEKGEVFCLFLCPSQPITADSLVLIVICCSFQASWMPSRVF